MVGRGNVVSSKFETLSAAASYRWSGLARVSLLALLAPLARRTRWPCKTQDILYYRELKYILQRKNDG